MIGTDENIPTMDILELYEKDVFRVLREHDIM